MREGDTSDTYHIDRDGKLTQMRTYAGEQSNSRICIQDLFSFCDKTEHNCHECIEDYETRNASLDEAWAEIQEGR
jgi:hypothetical protein